MVAVSALLAASVVSPRSSTSRPFLSSNDQGHLAALGCTSLVSPRPNAPAVSSRPSYESLLASPRIAPRRSPREKKDSPEQAGDKFARGKATLAGNISSAVVCSILEADDNPVAQERLASQIIELQIECEQLKAAGQEQDVQIAQAAAQIAAYDHSFIGLNESLRQLQNQLQQADQEGLKVRVVGQALEHEKEELRVHLALASREQQSLQDKINVAQQAAGSTSSDQARLERDSLDASGELLLVEAKLDAATLELRAVEPERLATTATLECNLAASRDRAKEIAAEASSALQEAWSTATELADARQTLAAVEQRAADEDARALEMDAQAADMKTADDHTEAVDALQELCAEATICQAQLSGLNESECLLQYEISLERQLQCNDAIAAKRSRLEMLDLEEQCVADSAERQRQWSDREAKAALTQNKLQAELQNAQDVVLKSRESLGAIRAQLLELHRIGDTVEVSKQKAEASTNELDLKLARQRADHGEISQTLRAVQVEHEELQVQSAAAAAVANERDTFAERCVRNLTLEVEMLKHQRIERTLAAAAEENHRLSVEKCLRRELSDLQQELDLQRDELESRSAALATRTVQLHDEHVAAETDLEATQLSLNAVLSAHADADQCHSRELKAARQWARNTEVEPQRLLSELQVEAEDLRAEHSRLRGAIKRMEALNAGLRAQVHVYQHQYAEGMGCSPGSLAVSNSLGSLSLVSPFRLTAMTSTATLSPTNTVPGIGSTSPASNGLMQLLSGESPRPY